ncbi:MAG: HAMP domain-containing protein, partial [Acidimicrobiia bacterium]|nr:HAMP domain-containing protein [Acidimicrobiia bacterium]
MAVTLRSLPPFRRAEPGLRRGPVSPSGPKPFRDNTRLIVFGIILLLVVLSGLLVLANQSTALAPDFLTEFVLYALLATDMAMLLALTLVLARNIVKLVVEHRRALPFARFRAKLVAVLLGMTLLPAVLVLIVGSEMIRTSVDRWFNAPMDEVLVSANALAGDYYQERQDQVSAQADAIAGALAGADLSGPSSVGRVIRAEVELGHAQALEVYRVVRQGGATEVIAVDEVAAPGVPGASSRASVELARRAAESGEARAVESIDGAGDLIRTAVPIRGGGGVRGVVIASEYLTGQFAERARSMTQAYERYQQLRVLKQPLATVYLSFFLMLTLLILVAATWMGLYVAKRITRPVQMLAVAAREIGAGHFEQRLVPETGDEFGSLVEAFNSMAAELSASRRRLERSARDVARKHEDVEARRRYIETILERIATGVVSVDEAGRIGRVNAAAARLLGLAGDMTGLSAASVFGSVELKPLADLIDDAARNRREVRPQELAMTLDGRELHL